MLGGVALASDGTPLVPLSCPAMTDLQCSPYRNGKRFRCTYRENHGGRETIVVERIKEGGWRPWRVIEGEGCDFEM
jgi:hypothetical protein